MSVIHTNKTGTGFNSGQTGAMAGAASAPTPVLLPDLVAGWALTAGPQQTLDSTGVIASGTYDLTNGGSTTFSASGASFNGVNQGLYRAATGLQMGSNLLFMSCECTVRTMSPGNFRYILAGTKDVGTDPWSNSYSQPTSEIYFRNEVESLGPGQTGLSLLTRYCIFIWISGVSGGTCTLNIQIDNGAVNSTSGIPLIVASDFFNVGCAFYTGGVSLSIDGLIRRVRGWSSVAAPLSAITWLYNSGSGRTDAELAAYTG